MPVYEILAMAASESPDEAGPRRAEDLTVILGNQPGAVVKQRKKMNSDTKNK